MVLNFKKVLSLKPMYADVHFLLGGIYVSMSKYRDAEAEDKKANVINSKCIDVGLV